MGSLEADQSHAFIPVVNHNALARVRMRIPAPF